MGTIGARAFLVGFIVDWHFPMDTTGSRPSLQIIDGVGAFTYGPNTSASAHQAAA